MIRISYREALGLTFGRDTPEVGLTLAGWWEARGFLSAYPRFY